MRQLLFLWLFPSDVCGLLSHTDSRGWVEPSSLEKGDCSLVASILPKCTQAKPKLKVWPKGVSDALQLWRLGFPLVLATRKFNNQSSLWTVFEQLFR